MRSLIFIWDLPYMGMAFFVFIYFENSLLLLSFNICTFWSGLLMQLLDLLQLLLECGELRQGRDLSLTSLTLLVSGRSLVPVQHPSELCKHITEHGVLLLPLFLTAATV